MQHKCFAWNKSWWHHKLEITALPIHTPGSGWDGCWTSRVAEGRNCVFVRCHRQRQRTSPGLCDSLDRMNKSMFCLCGPSAWPVHGAIHLTTRRIKANVLMSENTTRSSGPPNVIRTGRELRFHTRKRVWIKNFMQTSIFWFWCPLKALLDKTSSSTMSTTMQGPNKNYYLVSYSLQDTRYWKNWTTWMPMFLVLDNKSVTSDDQVGVPKNARPRTLTVELVYTGMLMTCSCALTECRRTWEIEDREGHDASNKYFCARLADLHPIKS